MTPRDKMAYRFVAAMYVSIFVPMFSAIYLLHLAGPNFPVQQNNAVFVALVFGVIWTMLVFVFGGLVRRE